MTTDTKVHEWLPANEFDAFDIIRAMREKYGWRLRVFTRADAENAYDGSEAEGEFTDEEWTKLRNSKTWRDYDITSEEWEELHATVYDVLGGAGERAERMEANEAK